MQALWLEGGGRGGGVRCQEYRQIAEVVLLVSVELCLQQLDTACFVSGGFFVEAALAVGCCHSFLGVLQRLLSLVSGGAHMRRRHTSSVLVLFAICELIGNHGTRSLTLTQSVDVNRDLTNEAGCGTLHS
jgi:hypothetical protein